jgi:hypothetical protein
MCKIIKIKIHRVVFEMIFEIFWFYIFEKVSLSILSFILLKIKKIKKNKNKIK